MDNFPDLLQTSGSTRYACLVHRARSFYSVMEGHDDVVAYVLFPNYARNSNCIQSHWNRHHSKSPTVIGLAKSFGLCLESERIQIALRPLS